MELIEAFDQGIWNALQSLRPILPFIDPILQTLCWLDNLWLLLALIVIFTLIAMANGQRGKAIFVLAAFALAGVLAWGTQPLVERERPVGVVNWIETLRTPWSFPSEHTLMATATYLALMIAMADWFPPRRILIRVIGISLVFFLGWNRMFVGACYPTDVMGGWLGGVGCVLLCRWVQERIVYVSRETGAATSS
jgi:undecaprenyl-diphosphatase